MNKSGKPEFDQYANDYTDLHKVSVQISGEDPAFFASYKAKYVAAQVGHDSKAKALSILDFGCGVGNTISHLSDEFPTAELYGTDPSGESIRLALKAHASEATFRAIENARIPYDDKSFDLVIAACVFHHIPPSERSHWISEIRRVLKPRGQVFIFEHNVLNPLTVKTVKECPFDKDAILLPRSELLNLARNGRFESIRSQYIVFFPKFLAYLRPLEPAMGWIPFGAQYVVQGVAE